MAAGGETKSAIGADTGGVYDATESGLKFRHMPKDSPTPQNGEEFLQRIQNNFQMNVLERPNDNELVFEMIGVDVSFANALRRILLSDIPTIAIEHVYMWNNSSIIHDEVLAHRMGLIPINADARLFEDMDENDDAPTDLNTVVFRLAVSCNRSDEKKKKKKSQIGNDGSQDASVGGNKELDDAANKAAEHARRHSRNATLETPGRPYTKHVYSSDLQWLPQGDQEQRFPDGIKPVHDDILIAKLRPGQEIELEAHGRRGTGRDHAKFSPVATACYRLMVHIEIVKPIYDELAEELVYLYEPGVFELVQCDHGNGVDPPNTKVKAKVCNPYACTMSRNFMKNPTLKESIRMSRIPNHFIFSIESVGMMKPSVLVAEALRVLQSKCQNVVQMVDDRIDGNGGGVDRGGEED